MPFRRDGGLQRLVVALDGLDGLVGKTGWFETARYSNGTPVAYVASIQEFGDGKIPARPFVRTTVAARSDEWIRQFGEGSREILKGGALTGRQVLETVVMGAAGDIAKTISEITSPPLSPLTLLARKKTGINSRITGGKELGELADELGKGPPNLAGVSTKPLVWTKLMIQSVTGVVEEKK